MHMYIRMYIKKGKQEFRNRHTYAQDYKGTYVRSSRLRINLLNNILLTIFKPGAHRLVS